MDYNDSLPYPPYNPHASILDEQRNNTLLDIHTQLTRIADSLERISMPFQLVKGYGGRTENVLDIRKVL